MSEPVITGTLYDEANNLPLMSGYTCSTALAAPVDVGIMSWSLHGLVSNPCVAHPVSADLGYRHGWYSWLPF